jgi:hypothetical protein
VLGAAAARVAEFLPEQSDAVTPESPAEVAGALLLGLKNWEQGCIDQAVGWFGKVATSQVGDNEWASIYRQIAGNYLDDHKLLKSADYETLPSTIEGCEELKRRLDEALKIRKTRGRISYNLRQRQLQVARHARQLAREAANQQPEPIRPQRLADALPAIKQLIRESRFSEATKRLKAAKTAGAADLAQQKAWLYLTDASSTFLSDLASDMQQGMTGLQLSTVDGTATYDRVAGVGETGPLLAAGDGQPVEVPWGNIRPTQLIAIHQVVVRGETNPLEQARRHEQAIAYQFLVGDRESARVAGGRLADSSPAFRQRWAEAMQALKM